MNHHEIVTQFRALTADYILKRLQNRIYEKTLVGNIIPESDILDFINDIRTEFNIEESEFTKDEDITISWEQEIKDINEILYPINND